MLNCVSRWVSITLSSPRTFMLTLLSSARGQMCFCRRGWFTDEIVQYPGHSGELMRHAVWNNNYLASTYRMFLPALNFGAADFVRCDLLRIDRLAAGDQSGCATA